ncbi:trypsin-1-like [Harmonia axyridis]|uniref:trypsin-1-like n=1 Tax=Harmonia axyridis TaxID=115357 RepID=UPI001E27725E|nr:trypsin-1-like [Harmonia axyridis]
MKLEIITLLLTFGCANLEDIELSIEEDDSPENTNQRIVGGTEADITEFPWQVGINYKGKHNCGGSILNNHYILTAAHCTYKLLVSKLEARVGTSYRNNGGLLYRISSKDEHPEYNREDFQYDISLLRIDGKFEFTHSVQPVGLPSEDSPDPEPGIFATVSGFGQLHVDDKFMSSHLRAVDVPIIAKQTCKVLYRKYIVDDSMICALYPGGGKDACSGDSGGPLTIGDVQIGIVSWGIGCGSAKYPGVYASVKNVMDFISEIAFENSE